MRRKKAKAPKRQRKSPRVPVGTRVIIVSGGPYGSDNRPGEVVGHHYEGYAVKIEAVKNDEKGHAQRFDKVIYAEVVRKRKEGE
jgi:hypothetical protein